MKRINLVLLSLTVFISCNSKKKEAAIEKTTPIVKTTETPSLANQVTDVFEEKFGTHEEKRRNHIDGFCFTGELTLQDLEIKEYSKSGIFSEKPLKVTGRFSHKGGAKKDVGTPGEYGMAFTVTLIDGSIHNFSMNTLDFFPVNTPEGFLQLMQAKVTGKKEDFAQLMIDHPEFKNYKVHYAAKPKQGLKGYSNHQFNSVNSFYFENNQAEKTAVRWSFVPYNNEVSIDTSKEVDFFSEMKTELDKNKLLQWGMEVAIANDDDLVNEAATIWTGEHKKIVAAILTVTDIKKEGECDDMNFDPLVLQAGILPSEDPVLKFRSPSYAMSFGRRLQEKQSK